MPRSIQTAQGGQYGSFYADEVTGTVFWTPSPGKPVRLEGRDVDALLNTFQSIQAVEDFNDLYEANKRSQENSRG